ncbi:MAG: DUF4199 domain-containing protein [Ginsengibacter sp.]
MEQEITTSSTKGIVISLVLIVIAMITYFLDINNNSYTQYISFAVFIIGIIWSVNNYGNQIDHNSTFGNYFAHGFKIAALVTAIMIIYVVVFVYLFPDVKEKGMEAARKSMQEKGKLSQEQINQSMEFTKKFFMVFVIAGTLLGYLIFGAISALIGAAVTKKNPRPIEFDR